MAFLQHLGRRLRHFYEAPIATLPLGIFRISIAGFTLLQAGLWYPDWVLFFGREGWVQWEISKAFNKAWNIHLADLYPFFESWGLTDTQFIYLFFWVYFISALGLLVGWYTRIWAILTWLCHFVLMSSLPTFVYGVDIFLHISLFYLMCMPTEKVLSLDVHFGRVSASPNWATTLAIRVLQLHLCLVYFSAGYEKMLYPNWWEGDVLWRAVVQPDFNQFNFEWLANYRWIAIGGSVFTMIIETFYFIGMWVPTLRVAWLVSIVALHVGIGLFIGLNLFALIMILLSLSAFGYDAWQDIITKLLPSYAHETKFTKGQPDHFAASQPTCLPERA